MMAMVAVVVVVVVMMMLMVMVVMMMLMVVMVMVVMVMVVLVMFPLTRQIPPPIGQHNGRKDRQSCEPGAVVELARFLQFGRGVQRADAQGGEADPPVPQLLSSRCEASVLPSVRCQPAVRYH